MSEREPTTGRVSSRFPYWFAPHTARIISKVGEFVTTFWQDYNSVGADTPKESCKSDRNKP